MQTILVVEDESLIADLLAEILGDEGYKVIKAGDGQEALRALEAVRPNLILSDIMMPVMDGRELYSRLQAHPEYHTIPLVLMSSAYTSIRLSDYKLAAFIRKPFDIEDLLRTLRIALSHEHA